MENRARVQLAGGFVPAAVVRNLIATGADPDVAARVVESAKLKKGRPAAAEPEGPSLGRVLLNMVNVETIGGLVMVACGIGGIAMCIRIRLISRTVFTIFTGLILCGLWRTCVGIQAEG